jgi:hypothetical protein
MRVRDILRKSLDLVVARGLLPPYPPRVRVSLPPERPGAVWSNKQLAAAMLGSVDGSFQGNVTAWERAFRFVDDFRASSAARTGPAAWPLPRCFGPFPRVSEEVAYRQLATALQAGGLNPIATHSVTHRGRFSATDKVPIRSFPVFYGQWLAERHGTYPWDDTVDLMVVVEGLVFSEFPTNNPRAGDEPEPYVSLEFSAPALALALDVASHLTTALGPPRPPRIPAAAARMLVNLVADRWTLPRPFVIP